MKPDVTPEMYAGAALLFVYGNRRWRDPDDSADKASLLKAWLQFSDSSTAAAGTVPSSQIPPPPPFACRALLSSLD